MGLINSEKAEKLRKKIGLTYDQIIGIRFAINVTLATVIVWLTLKVIDDTNPIWAIASMVAASDPDPVEAKRMFKARIINVLVGCAVGLAFILFGGANPWMLPLALGTTVIVSTFFVKIKTMWRQAPITAAVVIAATLLEGTRVAGFGHGLHKVAEVIFGCIVGIGVSLLMSKVWFIKIQKS